MPLVLLGLLFVKERDRHALAALGAGVHGAVEPDSRRGTDRGLLIRRLGFERHHQT